VYPEYSIGGWIIMLGWRRSGLRPTPSAGTGLAWANGVSNRTMSETKKAARPIRTAVA
jgi:hypothetical protein